MASGGNCEWSMHPRLIRDQRVIVKLHASVALIQNQISHGTCEPYAHVKLLPSSNRVFLGECTYGASANSMTAGAVTPPSCAARAARFRERYRNRMQTRTLVSEAPRARLNARHE